MPENNVILAYCTGLAAFLLIRAAKAYGYDVPPDIASGLPMALAVAVAHLYDYVVSRVKK